MMVIQVMGFQKTYPFDYPLEVEILRREFRGIVYEREADKKES